MAIKPLKWIYGVEMKNNYYKKSFESSCVCGGYEITIQKKTESDLLYIFLQSKESIEAISLPCEGAANGVHYLLGQLFENISGD